MLEIRMEVKKMLECEEAFIMRDNDDPGKQELGRSRRKRQ